MSLRCSRRSRAEYTAAIEAANARGAESVKPLLRELAKEDPDRGTRANSAFGLDRMGDPEGVPLYFKATDEAFVEKDPLALAYLGGLVLMGDRALPGARERLEKYEDWQAKVQLISYIQSRKDKASLNLLTEIARDESQNDAVRQYLVRNPARIGDRLYVHGSLASRSFEVLTSGVPACMRPVQR